MKICGDIHNFVLIAGVIITAVVDTGDYALSQIFIDSMTLAIYLLLVTMTAPIINTGDETVATNISLSTPQSEFK